VLPAAPSRLQQEVELLVALDVEYTHLKLVPGGRHITLPAEVCAVDASGRVLLYEHCNPLSGELGGRPAAGDSRLAGIWAVRSMSLFRLLMRVKGGAGGMGWLAALTVSRNSKAYCCRC
jgi:hypothetical protein